MEKPLKIQVNFAPFESCRSDQFSSISPNRCLLAKIHIKGRGKRIEPSKTCDFPGKEEWLAWAYLPTD